MSFTNRPFGLLFYYPEKGVLIMTLLSIVQAGLILGKLFGILQWSWPLIFTPLWIMLSIYLIVGLVLILKFFI